MNTTTPAVGSLTETPLDQVLRSLRIHTTIFCRSALRAPWGFAVKAHGRAAFHVLLDGSCDLVVQGGESPIRVSAGDVIILPRGPEHLLRSDPSAPIEWLDDILARTPLTTGQLGYGGSGARADLICGIFSIEHQEAVPLLAGLPTVAHVRAADGPHHWLGPLLELIRAEVGSFEPGAESVAARIGDVLLLQVVRHVLQRGQPVDVFDVKTSAALRLLNEGPELPWTVEALAQAVFTSPSGLSDRFRRATGMPPMRYLTRLRTAAAARMLHTSEATLADVAAQVGYGSEAALSKAFTREIGVSPRAYRRSSQEQNAAPTSSVNKRAESSAA